jgi:hypothetical protein
VPTRKEWRNRDASAGESVLALLQALREGLGAQGVALFDDDRAEPHRLPPNFWDAFEERPCAEIDWYHFYRDLRASERVDTTCGCGGAHRLLGFLIHDRWALLIVAPPSGQPGVAAAIASSVKALAAQLPPAREPLALAEPEEERGPAAGSGGLLWWVRKAPQ